MEANRIISKYQSIIREYKKDETVVFTLIEFITGVYKTELLLNNVEIDESKLNELVMLYCNGKSVQYITNNAYFLGRNFFVDERVLIPRFETEEVVTHAINLIRENNLKNVYEVGSGSGVIAITLNLECDVNVDSVDISSEALDVAKMNNEKLGASVNFYLGNILENIDDKYDLIISNPPYIPNDGFVDQETLDNEPHLALYGGADGLDFYREIINGAKNLSNLKYIIFEIGYDQGLHIESMIDNVTIIRDINGHDRTAIIDLRR